MGGVANGRTRSAPENAHGNVGQDRKATSWLCLGHLWGLHVVVDAAHVTSATAEFLETGGFRGRARHSGSLTPEIRQLRPVRSTTSSTKSLGFGSRVTTNSEGDRNE